MALRNARDLYTRRDEGVSIWVVPAAAITASSPDEKDAFFDPAADKAYRHPTFYDDPRGGEAPVTSSTADSPRDRTPARRRPTSPTYALRLGDDALVLAQRLGEWITRAPAARGGRRARPTSRLDLLGQARSLLTYAGEVEGAGRTRTTWPTCATSASSATCSWSSSPNGDFARHHRPAARLLDLPVRAATRALRRVADATLAALAAKAVKEVDYHRDHATQWVLRLGDGTEESHRRMQAGARARSGRTSTSCSSTDELSSSRSSPRASRSTPSTLRAGWDAVRRRACSPRRRSTVPDGLRTPPGGGRRGMHTEALGLPARRDAAPAPRAPGGDMVTDRDRVRPARRRADATALRRRGTSPAPCPTRRCRC